MLWEVGRRAIGEEVGHQWREEVERIWAIEGVYGDGWVKQDEGGGGGGGGGRKG